MADTSKPSPNKKHCVDQSAATSTSDVDQDQATSSETIANPNVSTSHVSGAAMATAVNTSADAKELNSQNLRKSDEVAQIRRGALIFGTLEIPIKDQDTPEKVALWKVRWNKCDFFTGVVYYCPLFSNEDAADLIFTDRPLYKGCKVRRAKKSDGLVGICRDVYVTVDLRVIGTSTLITGARIEMFKHLKEFKQKSVVYKSGWLGVIVDVKRAAQIRLVESNVSCEVGLNHILPVGALEIEEPWISEEIPGINFQPSLARFPEGNSMEKLTKRSIKSLFIEDLKVESVTVLWRYQVDALRPDTPPQTITGARLKDLQIVMEELSSDASFQVGNLGRFKITPQTEFTSMSAYSTNFVQAHMGVGALSSLDNPYQKPKNAYDPDPEKRLTPDTVAVVEIVHSNTMGDIIWQDGTMDWIPGKDLIVQDGSLLDNILTPGDFLYSNELKTFGPLEQVYAVVTRYDLKDKHVTVKVLTCASPPKMLTTLCLPESAVAPHSRYKHFNQTNTVVVLQRKERICVGHVRRTNPDGKVQVLWLHNHKEEWVWPADCSVYSVKGHDLECIISLINDEDETKEVDLHTKFLRLTQKIRRINEVWNEADDEIAEGNSLIKLRQESLTELRTILQECRQIEDEVIKTGPKLFSDESISLFSTKIGQLIEENRSAGDGGSPQHVTAYTNPELVQTMIELCTELLKRGEKLELSFGKTEDSLRSLSSSEPMDKQPLTCSSALASAKTTATDMETGEPESNTPSSAGIALLAQPTDNLEDTIFETNVVVEDCHPEGHIYANKTEFQPTQIQYFVKIVRNELNNLRDQCPPGIKVKAYGDRFDLFSILIRGPANTPYENSVYLFDAVLPPNYPAVPPQFHFHSYRAGRLNPNLYAEGKVCVSLLGTWEARNHQEKWTKESNIVQVLLSIQALILVSEPYHNEPGLEADRYKPEEARKHCHEYNVKLIPKLMVMMINQIEHPMEPWKKEIKNFYKVNLPKFIGRWDLWLDIASKSSKRDDFLKNVGFDKPEFEIYPIDSQLKAVIQGHLTKLRTLLTTLEAGEDEDEGVITQDGAGDAGRAEEPGMIPAEDQEPGHSAAMEVDA